VRGRDCPEEIAARAPQVNAWGVFVLNGFMHRAQGNVRRWFGF